MAMVDKVGFSSGSLGKCRVSTEKGHWKSGREKNGELLWHLVYIWWLVG